MNSRVDFVNLLEPVVKAANRGDARYIALQIKGVETACRLNLVSYNEYILFKNVCERLLADIE